MIYIDSKLRTQLDRRLMQLKNDQATILPHWKELRDYIQPFRGRFEGERPNQHLPDMHKMVDSKPMVACDVLSSGMQEGLTSPSRDWFKITTADPDLAKNQSVCEWCDEVHSRMMNVLRKTNFYKATINLYYEMACYGTGCMTAIENFENIMQFETLTCGTYYLGLGKNGGIEIFYRDFWMTAEQLVREFGAENVSLTIRNAAENTPDSIFEVHHAIEPDMSHHARFPFRSVYWQDSGDTDTALRVGGYYSFPVMCPRWDVMNEGIYGFGPGSKALPDSKQLQALSMSRLIGVQKLVDPPLQVNKDLRNSNVMTSPSGITYVDQVGPMIASLYNLNLPLDQISGLINETKSSIDSNMYVNYFLMLNNSVDHDKTATEAAILQEEKGIMLGPVLERLTSECHTPAIERLFEVMSRSGQIPPVPQDLSEQPLKIEYVSILAQAQKLMGLRPLEQLLSFTGNLVAVNPEIMDNIDFDQAVRTYSNTVGSPANVLRDSQEVDSMRQSRAQAQQQQQQMEQAAQMSQSGQQSAQAAKLLSETDMGPNNALGALLGTAAGPAGGTDAGY